MPSASARALDQRRYAQGNAYLHEAKVADGGEIPYENRCFDVVSIGKLPIVELRNVATASP